MPAAKSAWAAFAPDFGTHGEVDLTEDAGFGSGAGGFGMQGDIAREEQEKH